MKTRRLGRTGLAVSPIAIGGASFGYVQKTCDWDPWSDAGRRVAVGTIHHALDRGINYIDTAPLYGAGHSETLVGEVLRRRRTECVIATKTWFEKDFQGTVDSVHESLGRLQTDYIDIVQIHGRMYTPSDYRHVVEGGPLDALRVLRDQGKIGFIGLTTEEPWTAIQFIRQGDVDMFQIAYNLIYQAASRHFLLESSAADAGVVTMRTMTSGVLQRLAGYLAPEWQEAHDIYDVSLKFALSDSRVHSAIASMRWAHEVDKNVQVAESWVPPVDLATLPRLTSQVYEAEDAEAGMAG